MYGRGFITENRQLPNAYTGEKHRRQVFGRIGDPLR